MDGSWLFGAAPELMWIAATLAIAYMQDEGDALGLAAMLLGTPVAIVFWAASVADTPLAASAAGATLLHHTHQHHLLGLLISYMIWYLGLLALPAAAVVANTMGAPRAERVLMVGLFLPYYLGIGYLLDVMGPDMETVWSRADGSVEVVRGGMWTGPRVMSLPAQDLACLVRHEPLCYTDDDGEEECYDRWRPVLGAGTHAATLELTATVAEAPAQALCARVMAAAEE
jgi:hypothetical protein